MKSLNVFENVQVKFVFNFKFSCWLSFFPYVDKFIYQLLLRISIYKITSHLRKIITGDWNQVLSIYSKKSFAFGLSNFCLQVSVHQQSEVSQFQAINLEKSEFHSHSVLGSCGILCYFALCLWLNICHRRRRENYGVYIWHDQIWSSNAELSPWHSHNF